MKQKPSLSAVFFTLAAALVCYFLYTVLSAIMGGNCLSREIYLSRIRET